MDLPNFGEMVETAVAIALLAAWLMGEISADSTVGMAVVAIALVAIFGDTALDILADELQ